jgi:hypothetical protein
MAIRPAIFRALQFPACTSLKHNPNRCRRVKLSVALNSSLAWQK